MTRILVEPSTLRRAASDLAAIHDEVLDVSNRLKQRTAVDMPPSVRAAVTSSLTVATSTARRSVAQLPGTVRELQYRAHFAELADGPAAGASAGGLRQFFAAIGVDDLLKGASTLGDAVEGAGSKFAEIWTHEYPRRLDASRRWGRSVVTGGVQWVRRNNPIVKHARVVARAKSVANWAGRAGRVLTVAQGAAGVVDAMRGPSSKRAEKTGEALGEAAVGMAGARGGMVAGAALGAFGGPPGVVVGGVVGAVGGGLLGSAAGKFVGGKIGKGLHGLFT